MHKLEWLYRVMTVPLAGAGVRLFPFGNRHDFCNRSKVREFNKLGTQLDRF
jgi:hypothetical protein